MENDCRKITADEALSITLELWQHLAKTGDSMKGDWEGWKRHDLVGCRLDCALCQYAVKDEHYPANCDICPYHMYYGKGCLDTEGGRTPLDRWYKATSKRSRMYWARQCVKQIEAIINKRYRDRLINVRSDAAYTEKLMTQEELEV